MALNKKFFSLVSSYTLVANLTLKPINSIDISDVKEFARRFGVTFAGGAAAPIVCVVPSFAMSISDSIKKRSKGIRGFLNILKRNSNTTLRAIKWSAGILGVTSAAGFVHYCSKHPRNPFADANVCITCASFGISSGVFLTSWIGQKLTEDKDKTQKNDEPKIANSNEKEIAK